MMPDHRDDGVRLTQLCAFSDGAQAWEAHDVALGTTGGPLQQSFAWASYQSTFHDRQPEGVFALQEEHGSALTLSLVSQRLPRGMTYLMAPRGPLIDASASPRALASLQRALRAAFPNALFCRLDPALAIDSPDAPRWNEMLTNARAWPSYVETTPTTTLLLDLSNSENALLAQMHPKGRYNIKVAERHGVVCRRGDVTDLPRVHALLRETASRTGIAVHPEHVYAKMLASLGPIAALELAEIDGELLAALITTQFGGTTTYYYGASGGTHREAMAPYALQWHAIRAARSAGDRWYDFLGIAPVGASSDHPLAGVTDFKRKFGGIFRTDVPPIDLPLRPTLARAFRLARKARSLLRR